MWKIFTKPVWFWPYVDISVLELVKIASYVASVFSLSHYMGCSAWSCCLLYCLGCCSMSIWPQNLCTSYPSWNVLSLHSSSFTTISSPPSPVWEGHGGMALKRMSGEGESSPVVRVSVRVKDTGDVNFSRSTEPPILGRMSVSEWRTFTGLHRTCSWW